MPGKELTYEEYQALNFWISCEGGQREKLMANNQSEVTIFKVDTEPIMVETTVSHTFHKGHRPGLNLTYSVLCSKGHAQRLEEEGIVRFTPVVDETTK